MTTTTVAPAFTGTDGSRSAAPAVGGVTSAAAFVGAAVLFADGLGGASSAADAARALQASGGRIFAAVLLLTVSALLACLVVAALAGRVRDGASVPGRLLLPFGVLHFVLAAAAFWPMAGAVSVGRDVLDTDVSAVAAEQVLISLNSWQPLAGMLGAAFLICVFAGCGVARWIRISALVMAVGLLLPPVGWAVLYLLPLWTAATGVALWRRAD